MPTMISLSARPLHSHLPNLFISRSASDQADEASDSSGDSEDLAEETTVQFSARARNYSNIMHAHTNLQMNSLAGTLPAYTKVMYAFHENRMQGTSFTRDRNSNINGKTKFKSSVTGNTGAHSNKLDSGSNNADASLAPVTVKLQPVQRSGSEGALVSISDGDKTTTVEDNYAGPSCPCNTPETSLEQTDGHVEAGVQINGVGVRPTRPVTDPLSKGGGGVIKAKDWATG